MRHWYGQNYNKGTHTNKNTCNPPLRMKDGNKKTPLIADSLKLPGSVA